ncbi:hypothetical protein PSKAS_28130 [Peribacillus sp. N1]
MVIDIEMIICIAVHTYTGHPFETNERPYDMKNNMIMTIPKTISNIEEDLKMK